MKKLLLNITAILLFSVSLIGCNKNNQAASSIQNTEYELECHTVSGNMVRCENKEVICYGSNGTFLDQKIVGEGCVSCKFKKD